MKKMTLALLTLSLELLAPVAHADSSRWYHVRPLESGPVSVLIDFQVRYRSSPRTTPSAPPRNYANEAAPVWVNVRRSDLDAKDHVRVMVINYLAGRYRGEPRGSQEVVDEFDLEFVEPGHFSAEAKPIMIYQSRSDGYAVTSYETVRQEVVVWINGQLYKDPSTRKNLGFDVRDYLQ